MLKYAAQTFFFTFIIVVVFELLLGLTILATMLVVRVVFLNPTILGPIALAVLVSLVVTVQETRKY